MARRKLGRISRCDVLRASVFAMSSGLARGWRAVGDAEKEREARGGLGRKSSKLLLRMVADGQVPGALGKQSVKQATTG